MKIRIGQGIDIHPFAKEPKALMLGGVEIPDHPGLEGHSDADALTHAMCDAILGALNLGDIGQHFPDTDPQYKGKNSLFFLDHIAQMVRDKGWQIENIDSTILTETPRIKPHVHAMQVKLSDCLRISVDCVSIKATRPEKLGSFGRKEGLMVMSVALLTSH